MNPVMDYAQRANEFQDFAFLELVDGQHWSLKQRKAVKRIQDDDRITVDSLMKLYQAKQIYSIYDVTPEGKVSPMQPTETQRYLRARNSYLQRPQNPTREREYYTVGGVGKQGEERYNKWIEDSIQAASGTEDHFLETYFGGDPIKYKKWFDLCKNYNNNDPGTLWLEVRQSRVLDEQIVLLPRKKELETFYLTHNDANKAMKERVSELVTQNTDTLEEIADVHRALEALLPFQDYNTRTNRIHLHRLLIKANLGAGVLLYDPLRVHFYTTEQWAKELGQGIVNWNTLYDAIKGEGWSPSEVLEKTLEGEIRIGKGNQIEIS
ncbi:MAG: hypothetical protein AAFQ98_17880 [Bacteroidota bacterium]